MKTCHFCADTNIQTFLSTERSRQAGIHEVPVCHRHKHRYDLIDGLAGPPAMKEVFNSARHHKLEAAAMRQGDADTLAGYRAREARAMLRSEIEVTVKDAIEESRRTRAARNRALDTGGLGEPLAVAFGLARLWEAATDKNAPIGYKGLAPRHEVEYALGAWGWSIDEILDCATERTSAKFVRNHLSDIDIQRGR